MSAGAIDGVRSITLTVKDLAKVRDFYVDVVGLRVLDEAAGVAHLGVDGAALLELVADPAVTIGQPRFPGLFHTAFLLPSHADLGAWLHFAAGRRYRLDGAADHAVSDAVYLSDPEGNGIEIYADRPRETWPWKDGEVQFVNDPMDFEGIAGRAKAPWQGAPAGTIVGHVHLRVGELGAARAFYGEVLGLPVTASHYSGAMFYGAGRYHHHLGTNIWASRGAGARPIGTTGLARVTFTAIDAPEPIAARADKAGIPVERVDEGIVLADPWGTQVLVAA
ncbi:VOC family protein [Acuticoccus sp. I52.16.1]|uniref:VOC family protein n=1 Tax=Acuticoccus sp. I52.16.1 TaxID=2928472 RepID=UPI001FD0F77E|nr:VOC family protein [Acuticoccus sp. I52.16.1]UOM34064.1 VOC family protein [Acuticoccus sp. I52.16.1]